MNQPDQTHVDLFIGKDKHIYFMGTRFLVWMVIDAILNGSTDEEIHALYPDLPRGSCHSAKTYYEVHKKEMDAVIRANAAKAAVG
jgi:uncharacterized protein (DUF433 family)